MNSITTTIKELIKKVVFLLLGNQYSANYRISRLQKSEKVTILNLHRVGEKDGSSYCSLDPKIFEELLKFLECNFELITFANITETTVKQKLILSFDDGYKDFIDIACPLLYKHGIRVNHNIIPSCIENQLPPLNVMAQDFVGKAPKELVRRLQIPGFPNTTDDKLGYRLSLFIKSKPFAEQLVLKELLTPQFFEWNDFIPTPMMSRTEVLQVGAIHEMGGHSYSHASMQYESEEYFRADLDQCKKYFEELFGYPMNIYAFPNGSHSETQIRVVMDSGVKHILLVGENFDNGESPHYRFTFDAQSLNEARFRATGAFKIIKL